MECFVKTIRPGKAPSLNSVINPARLSGAIFDYIYRGSSNVSWKNVVDNQKMRDSLFFPLE